MKLGFSQQQIIETAQVLGLPSDGFIQRRIARAYDLVNTNKVSQIDDGIFRVRSQYEPDKSYIVNLNHGEPSCNCPDGERTINCKHRIASLLWLCNQEQSKQAVKVTWDDTENSYHKRGRWWVTDYKRRIKYIIYRDSLGNLICPCGRKPDCEHRKAIREYLGNDGGGNKRVVQRSLHLTSRIANECGSNEAKALQDNLNAQIDSQNGNGNGANKRGSATALSTKAPSQATQLDITDPFQEAEALDIDQIEGRRNERAMLGAMRSHDAFYHTTPSTEVTWKLSNGEYVISYRGIMTLADKHDIEYEVSLHDDTNTVIAKAMNGSERVSGKEIKIAGSIETASELAKRNAARQLIPLPEIKAIEHKAKLEAEFDWQKAKAKCVELVGEANVSIIIHELVKDGKLRKDNPSHYARTEWLLIHNACQQDASEVRDPKSLNRWSYNSPTFVEKCMEAINQVRAGKSIEANELPPQNGDGKRKLQMDKKLRTWLVEADGTKKEIACREIAEQYDSYSKGIVKRLRAGIDSGADISTVELSS